VNQSLPDFRQWLITRLLPAVSCCRLCSLKVCVQSSSLPSPLLPCAQATPPSLLRVLYSSLFIIQNFFFCGAGVSLSRELCWFVPEVAVGVTGAAYLLICWSASPKKVWSWCLAALEPSSFLNVTWHGEALCRLGVRGVGVFLLLGVFFLPSMALVSQQDFLFKEFMLSASTH
jgi:hypothetical protein